MKFIASKELGRLAKWLRILGFDTIYFKSDDKPALIIESLRTNRIILTRDSKMSRFSGVRMLHIKDDLVKDQIHQVIEDLKLAPDDRSLFTRCVICNKKLAAVVKEKIKSKVPEYVYKTQEEFVECPDCGRVYWHGTHWGNAQKYLEKAKK